MGKPRPMGAYDSLMAQWTNDWRPLVLCSDLASLITRCTLWKKAITLTTPATLEFPLLRKMYFRLKGFTRLRWVLLSAFFSFEPCVYYFHSTAGLRKLKFHSHQPASWLPGSGGWGCLASWRESLLSHLVSKLYWNWQERSYTKLRSINCPVEGKGQRANVALCLIVQAESGHQHQINSL